MPDEYTLEDILGFDLLASLLGLSNEKLLEYGKKPHTMPEEVFRRLAFIIEIIEILKGAYNPQGIRQWFSRKRAQLGGKSPAEILKNNWSPEDPGPRLVFETAKGMNI